MSWSFPAFACRLVVTVVLFEETELEDDVLATVVSSAVLSSSSSFPKRLSTSEHPARERRIREKKIRIPKMNL